jgi:hypothetical protein
MRSREFLRRNQFIDATLRVVDCQGAPQIVRLGLEAESLTQARALLCHLYGPKNILSVTPSLSEEGLKIISPQEQQVKSMSDQAKRLQQQAKQVKARNKLAKAQQQLVKATSQRANH